MKLEDYPIIKEYEVFPTGSYYIKLREGINSREDEQQYVKFLEEMHNEKRI